MKNTWDLSFLYKGFEDEAFQADLARLPEAIAELKAILDSDLPVQEKLEKLMDADEALSLLMDRLFNFAGLTLATDASNGTAQLYEDKLAVIEAFEDALHAAAQEPSAEERTAAALEFIAISAMPDA